MAEKGRVLVVGGGISGITAAIEASEAGCEVVLVERAPSLGGRVAWNHQYFPKLCPPACGLELNLRRIRTSPRIEVHTLCEVEEIRGGPGRYVATLRHAPRRVSARCTSCGACAAACPVERPDPQVGTTRAIYLPHPTAWPPVWVIDGPTCAGPTCAACVRACPYGAIELEAGPRTTEVEVAAVIWATGWAPPDATAFEGLGFGTHPDILTNVGLERLAAATGPTRGALVRPSDGTPPRSVAFVQCAGSRDETHHRHCSAVCCAATLKQVRYLRAAYPDLPVTVFYIDLRTPGRLEEFLARSQQDPHLRLVKGKVARVVPEPSGELRVEAEDVLGERLVSATFSMVVLATGMIPQPPSTRVPAPGLVRDDLGFLAPVQPLPGFLAAGCAHQPAEVAACVRDATAAALRAVQACARG